MNTNKIIQDFYHTLTTGIITLFFFIYVTFFEQFKGVLGIIRDIAPSIIFVAGMILIFSYDWKNIKRRKMKNEYEEVIQLNYLDALIHDMLAFLIAIIILTIPILFKNNLDRIDILQALASFLLVYGLKNYYFNKIGK